MTAWLAHPRRTWRIRRTLHLATGAGLHGGGSSPDLPDTKETYVVVSTAEVRGRHYLSKTLLSSLLVFALAIGLAAVPPHGNAEAATPRPITAACPAGQAPAHPFTDVKGHPYEAEIACVYAWQVVVGTTSTTYAPNGTVTRGQLATYLASLLTNAGRTRPTNLPNYFADDNGNPHEANINWLRSVGIVHGYGDGTYRPLETVTRAQVASYLNQTIAAVSGKALHSRSDFFVDDNMSPHHANINALADAGIVDGWGVHYQPTAPLVRGTMAAFVARSIDLLVEQGLVTAPFGVKLITVTPTATASPQTSTDAADNRGLRIYEVRIPVGMKDVNIMLLPAQSVTTTGSVPLFTAVDPVPANVGTSIESVNGKAVTAAAIAKGTTQVTGVTPVGGKITFTVDSVSARDIVPVVYENSLRRSEQRLDLVSGSGARQAAEAVGVGGRTVWQLAEPAKNLNLPVGIVRGVNISARTYTLDLGGDAEPEVILRWATNDAFRYSATGNSTITRSQFESWLSVGDRVDPSAYSPGSMTHVITGDVPNAPTNVVATAAGGNGMIAVTFTKPTNPVATISSSSYRLQRAPVTGGVVGSFAEVAAIAGNLPASITDTPATSGQYAYRVVARSVTGDSPASNVSQASFIAQTPVATASSINDTTTSGILDGGDTLTFTFDRPITVSSGWQVQVIGKNDVAGTLNATRANATVSGASSNVLTLTLTAAPATPGSVAIEIGNPSAFLQVVSATGIGNSTGWWNLPETSLRTGDPRTVIGTAPAAIPSMDVSTDVATSRATIQKDAANVTTGDIVRVYDASGVERGSGTKVADADLHIPVAGLANGQTIYVVISKGGANGRQSVTLKTTVTAVSVAGITPTSGPMAGGTSVTITGSGFRNGATVTVGGASASVTAVTETSITATAPAGTAGARDVVVTNPSGSQATLTGAFTYTSP